MTEPTYWAFVNEANVVEEVTIASDEWVAEWRTDHPDSTLRILPTDPANRDFAGIGYTWDEALGRFIPPSVGDDCWYDEEEWAWRCPPPPEA